MSRLTMLLPLACLKRYLLNVLQSLRSEQFSIPLNKSPLESGCVNQALAQALGEVLKDYYVFVAQLETQHRLGELTLNKMWSYIQPTMDAMAFMSDLCSTIHR